MIRVKLVGKGYDNFNGDLGMTKFENGVSEPISYQQANLLSALTRVEVIEGDGNKLTSRAYEANKSTPAPVVSSRVSQPDPVEPPKKPVIKYDRAQLEKIADEKGIQGLRAIGEEFDIRSNSIKGLITGIINAQQLAAE